MQLLPSLLHPEISKISEAKTYTTYLFHVDSSKWKRLSNTFPFPIHLPLSISHSVPPLDDSLNENERIIEGREREDEIYRRVRR